MSECRPNRFLKRSISLREKSSIRPNRIHQTLGPGLLESVYEACPVHELGRRAIAARRQVALPVTYEGMRIDAGFRLDLVVAEGVVVEVK